MLSFVTVQMTDARISGSSACKRRPTNSGDNDVGLALILTFVIGTILPLLSAPGQQPRLQAGSTPSNERAHSNSSVASQNLANPPCLRNQRLVSVTCEKIKIT